MLWYFPQLFLLNQFQAWIDADSLDFVSGYKLVHSLRRDAELLRRLRDRDRVFCVYSGHGNIIRRKTTDATRAATVDRIQAFREWMRDR